MTDPIQAFYARRLNPQQYQSVVEPVAEPVKISKVVRKQESSEDCEDCSEIIDKIISEKPTVKKVRKLIREYIQIKEEEDD